MTTATRIYSNGSIVTMDSRCSTVESIAIKDGKILGVGSAQEMKCFSGAATEHVDLRGKVMLPGFYDGHSHFMRAGMHACRYLDISAFPVGTIRNISQIAERIKAHAAKTPKGELITCCAYDDTALEECRHLTLAEMDAIAPDHPLFLRHVSGHLALANSAALRNAGLSGATPDPLGGRLGRDGQGNLTGVLEEPSAMSLVTPAIPDLSNDQWLEAVRCASNQYVARGVTTAQDGGVTDSMWDSYFYAHAQKGLLCRVQLLPRYGSFTLSKLPFAEAGTPLTSDNMLTLGAVKLFQDGSLQAYTGFLTNPYHKRIYEGLPEDWRGYPIRPRHELVKEIVKFHMQGYQVAVHGNGDGAIDDILEAFEEAQKAYPRNDARHILIHCQTAREDQLDRARRLGVVPSFFVVHTYYWGDRHEDIFLGPQRAGRLNPLRSAIKRGMRFTLHNDTFVTPMDPLRSVWSAVNRLSSSGRVIGPEQRISVQDALRAVTSWGAYQFCEENTKGSLEPGKLADMVVLEENPLTVSPESIKDIPIAATIVDDKLVFGTL